MNTRNSTLTVSKSCYDRNTIKMTILNQDIKATSNFLNKLLQGLFLNPSEKLNLPFKRARNSYFTLNKMLENTANDFIHRT